MATSTTPLLADDRPHSPSSYDDHHEHDHEETTLLGGLITTSPTRPLSTTFSPTLVTRSLALLLAIPSFIIFIVFGPSFAPSIVFLSFAIFRQLVVLGSYFGSQIVVIHIEVVHEGWKAASAKAQEKWIKRSIAAVIDGAILLGLLVTLSLVAHKVDVDHRDYTHPEVRPASVTAAVILGFLTFGLLLLSVPDFGSPNLVSLFFAIEKPGDGLLKVATHVSYGEPEETEEERHEREHRERRRTRKGNPRMPVREEV